MDNKFKWPVDLPDWSETKDDNSRYLWRGIQPSGDAFYSIAKPDTRNLLGDKPTLFTSFSLYYVGRTQDQDAINNWENSLQRRNEIRWRITTEYQVVQHDTNAEPDTPDALYDNEYTAYLAMSAMADDIFIDAMTELDKAAAIRKSFYEYLKMRNQ